MNRVEYLRARVNNDRDYEEAFSVYLDAVEKIRLNLDNPRKVQRIDKVIQDIRVKMIRLRAQGGRLAYVKCEFNFSRDNQNDKEEKQ